MEGRFFFFLWWSLSLFATDFILKPANGMNYPVTVFDPVVFSPENREGFLEFFRGNGYVILDSVSESEDREALIQLIQRIVMKRIPRTKKRGFLELHHDNTLAKLRQNPKLYEVFSHLLDEEKLWVVFDRVIHHLPNEEVCRLNPHVDQNPLSHPNFAYLQGIMALRDMDEFNGILALVPQSHLFFSDYIPWIQSADPFVIYQEKITLPFIAPRLKEGQIIIWDSRITHTRFCADHKNERLAVLLSFIPAQQDPKLRELRLKCFLEGIGWIDHEAGLRATSNPRYEYSLREEPEMLTPLGRKLYGLDSWF